MICLWVTIIACVMALIPLYILNVFYLNPIVNADPSKTLVLAWADFIALIGTGLIIFMIYVVFSMHVRRLHDFGQSGWLLLLSFVPFINFIVFLILLFYPGSQKENKYGSPPEPKIDFKNAFKFEPLIQQSQKENIQQNDNL